MKISIRIFPPRNPRCLGSAAGPRDLFASNVHPGSRTVACCGIPSRCSLGSPPSSAAPDGLRAGGEDAAGFSLSTCFLLSSFILGDKIPSHTWYFAKSTYFACLQKLESIFCYSLIRLQIHFYFQFFLSHRFCRGSPPLFFCTKRKNLQSCLLWIQDCGWDAFLLFRTTVSAGQSSWKLSN